MCQRDQKPNVREDKLDNCNFLFSKELQYSYKTIYWSHLISRILFQNVNTRSMKTLLVFVSYTGLNKFILTLNFILIASDSLASD